VALLSTADYPHHELVVMHSEVNHLYLALNHGNLAEPQSSNQHTATQAPGNFQQQGAAPVEKGVEKWFHTVDAFKPLLFLPCVARKTGSVDMVPVYWVSCSPWTHSGTHSGIPRGYHWFHYLLGKSVSHLQASMAQ
jgi:hypothetical protein